MEILTACIREISKCFRFEEDPTTVDSLPVLWEYMYCSIHDSHIILALRMGFAFNIVGNMALGSF